VPGRKAANPLEKARRQLLEEQETSHQLREDRGQRGTIGNVLALRELANQHREAFSKFCRALEDAADVAQKRGFVEGRRFLMTHAKADVHLLGMASSPVARWYIRQQLTSSFTTNRLLGFRGEQIGAEARAQLAEYVEEHGLAPALEGLWRQLGGPDQDPLSA
jgi:hypothetical protein